MRKTKTLLLEALEDRCVPAQFGIPWTSNAVTLSFASDLTPIYGQTSNLNTGLAAEYGPNWQADILKAFQTWAVQTNLNVGLVADGGQAFGTPGLSQHDPRFGDVRIGGATLSPDVLAITAPPDLLGSAAAGDVIVNTAQTFAAGGVGGYDLFTAFLQEAGHAFGMGNSTNPTSVMFNYQGVRTGLSTGDVAGLRGLYGGVRAKDVYEGSNGNNTLPNAQNMETINVNGNDHNQVFAVRADVTTNADVDFFRFKAPTGGSANVLLHSEGISLFVGTVSVYDKTGKLVATRSANGPLDNDVRLSLTGLKGGDDYFVSVSSARGDVFGIGTYALIVDPTPLTPLTASDVDAVANDPHFAGSTNMPSPPTPPSSGTVDLREGCTTTDATLRSYQALGQLNLLYQTQTFRVHSLDLGSSGVAQSMVVNVKSLDGLSAPRATVLDSNNRALAAKVLVNQDGSYSVSFAGIGSNKDYLIKVSSASPVLLQAGFSLTAFFTTKQVPTAVNLDGGALGGTTANSATKTLSVTQSQVAHFALAATGSSSSPPVTMTIYDGKGNVIFTLTAKPGETVTGDVRLPAGDYKVTYSFPTLTSLLGGLGLTDPPPTAYDLDVWTITDPIGPTKTDGSYGGNSGSGSTENSTTLAMK